MIREDGYSYTTLGTIIRHTVQTMEIYLFDTLEVFTNYLTDANILDLMN